MTWTGARALTGTEDGPSGVATDGTQVLFTSGRTQVGENAVRAVALNGPTTSRIVVQNPAGQGPNGRLAIDGDAVYIPAGSSIVRVPIAGGEVTTVVAGRPAGIDDVVVSGDDLWWTTNQYQAGPHQIELARMPKVGGPVEVVAVDVGAALSDPYPDGDTALVATPNGVLRERAGSQPDVVVDQKSVGGGAVSALAVDAQRIYVLVAGAKHGLLAIPRTGTGTGTAGPPAALADSVDDTGDVVIVGDQVVFWAATNLSGGSALKAVPAAGGAARTIASGPYADGDLAAVGTDRVVFSADGQVWVASILR